jgi:hypothetical protein
VCMVALSTSDIFTWKPTSASCRHIAFRYVQLEGVDPPSQVLSTFEEVQRAEQNQNKLSRQSSSSFE